METFNSVSGSIRISNPEGKRICSALNVSPTVQPATAAAFVTAIETIYNNGPCTARISLTMDIQR